MQVRTDERGHYDIVDLSRRIQTNMPVYPGVPKTFVGIYRGHEDTLRPGGISSQTNIIVMGDHAGTHIDAPLHFDPDGTGVDQMPLDIMIGNAVMQDYSYKNSGDTVTLGEVKSKLEKVEESAKNLKSVLFQTGAARLYPSDQYLSYYLEIHADIVEWLLDQGISIFGVDASTVDHARNRATHMTMRKRPSYHIENLTNLDKLPQDRVFTFVCTPLFLTDSSASPIRALALIPRI